MKIGIYARTSKYEQNPENQLIALRDYAERNKFQVYKEYVDQISGAKESRPKLDELMQDARAGKFDAVMVWKLDRLGRSLQHLLNIIHEWDLKEINFICTTQNIDTTTASGRMVFHMFAVISEFERELTKERVMLGLERARRQGKALGRPPGSKDKGYRRKGGYFARYQGKKSPPTKTGLFHRKNTKTNKQ